MVVKHDRHLAADVRAGHLGELRRAFSLGAQAEEIPGSSKKECGNYLEHDLDGARKECAAYAAILSEVKADD